MMIEVLEKNYLSRVITEPTRHYNIRDLVIVTQVILLSENTSALAITN